MIKLSIIIPIYTVEDYIVECLESVCCQLIDGIEVILVNDGTPDNSMLMAKEYINEGYSQYLTQFLFIDQKNQGLSEARNQGIAISQGEYIAFLDSDDKLQKNYFNKILNVIIENDVDLIQFSALRFDDAQNHSVFLKNNITNGLSQLDEKVLISIFENSSWFAWLRVYKRKLFEKDLFPIGRNYEDAFLVPKLILKSKNIYFLNENLIGYRLNFNGITFSKSKKNIDDCQYVVEDMIHNAIGNELYKYSAFNMLVHLLDLSLSSEGFFRAITRWHEIKVGLKELGTYNFCFKQRLLYFFGIYFVYVLKVYRWLKK